MQFLAVISVRFWHSGIFSPFCFDDLLLGFAQYNNQKMTPLGILGKYKSWAFYFFLIIAHIYCNIINSYIKIFCSRCVNEIPVVDASPQAFNIRLEICKFSMILLQCIYLYFISFLSQNFIDCTEATFNQIRD